MFTLICTHVIHYVFLYFLFEPNKLYRFKDSFIAHCTYCSQTPIQVFIFFFPFFLFFPLQLFMLFLPSFYSKFSKIFLLKEKIRKKHQFPQEIWRPTYKSIPTSIYSLLLYFMNKTISVNIK